MKLDRKAFNDMKASIVKEMSRIKFAGLLSMIVIIVFANALTSLLLPLISILVFIMLFVFVLFLFYLIYKCTNNLINCKIFSYFFASK